MDKLFKLKAPFKPGGDQGRAIEKLISTRPGRSTLLGVTGSGKTYTIAQVISRQSKPVLVLAPNKTLAAQLYEEFSLFFPENKVCYFVSYYDYYQPESYLPAQDIYIPKETKINSEIERLRMEATASIINRRETIIVSSVSCIYSLGSPVDYKNLTLKLKIGDKFTRREFIAKLIDIQYLRNEIERTPGTFQASGSTIEVILAYQKEKLRIEIDDDAISGLYWVDRQNNRVLSELDNAIIFPARHFVTTKERRESAFEKIRRDLDNWIPELENPIYKERIRTRVNHDLELLEQRGMCPGIENYSIYFDGRSPGQPPFCLLDFFDDLLLIIDESHISVPQLRGMYAGDRARKKNLVDFGFRLPSALDNRPLKFEEITKYFKDAIFVSATPGDYELRESNCLVEQIIRPTGILDPVIEVRPRVDQMTHLLDSINKSKKKGYRSLVLVLTKKLAEDLAKYLQERKIKVCYMHCDIKTPQRTELIHKLRKGVFDCLVGINLLREGLDIPEVSLVAILDADLESFLRDKRSLVQIIGRAARNIHAKVILYGDKITGSMRGAIKETNRRRKIQKEFNIKHNIKPLSVKRDVVASISPLQKAILEASNLKKKKSNKKVSLNKEDFSKKVFQLEKEMDEAAKIFDFEKAIKLRDEWIKLKALLGKSKS